MSRQPSVSPTRTHSQKERGGLLHQGNAIEIARRHRHRHINTHTATPNRGGRSMCRPAACPCHIHALPETHTI